MTDGTKIYVCKVCGKPEGEELDGSIEPGWQTEIECGPCDDCIAWEENASRDDEDDGDALASAGLGTDEDYER